MVKKKAPERAEERLEAVEGALSKSERFIEENQKNLTAIVVAIVVVVLGYFGLSRYYFEPREQQSMEEMFMAERYFERDSLNRALYGDGNNLGFLDIIDEYRRTDAANLSCYYAGVIYMKQGDFDAAIDMLGRFKSKDEMLMPISRGLMGDAYLELNDPDRAIRHYMQAAKASDNELTAPLYLFRAAQVHELQTDYRKALELYEKIKVDFATSNEGRLMDKYISRAEGLLNK